MDNMDFTNYQQWDVIYCDYIYENQDFSWAEKYFSYLSPKGVFIAQTDWHSQHRYRVFMEDVVGANFVNHLVMKCEWGNHPKNKFHQCYDDIIIYSNSNTWDFYSDKIQVPKVTLTKGMNPSGRTTKTATAWIDDVTLTTTAKERVKKEDGHLIKWQKPLKLYDRIIAPFVGENSSVLDPFAGTASLGLWCKRHNVNYLGIEYDYDVCNLAKKNIEGE
jgi:DNA modification methylase